MKLSAAQYKAIRAWMYRNARPIDLFRYRFHFEGGSAADVLSALSAFQNSDGGFAHALEADSWNPNSSPIQTWCATEILREIGHKDAGHPIVQGILGYLESGKDTRDGLWTAEVPTNDAFPHAPWWTWGENVISEWGYNPTAALAGFILRFAQAGSPRWETGAKLAREAAVAFLAKPQGHNASEIACFIQMLEWLDGITPPEGIDLAALRGAVVQAVGEAVTKDIRVWIASYCAKPSHFVSRRESPFAAEMAELAEAEAMLIPDLLGEDGAWPIVWRWDAYPAEWAISRRWWMGNLIIVNLRYLKGFSAL